MHMSNLTIKKVTIMPEEGAKLEELKNDAEIKEIVEIVRLSKASKEFSQSYEDKTRPIVTAKDYGDEVKIVNFTY